MRRAHDTRRTTVRIGAALALAVAATGSLATSAGAATITVSTTADGGAGSLRAAIDQANASAEADTIVLQAGAEYVLSACGADGLVSSGGPLTISGQGATIRQTCAGERVLRNSSDGLLTIEDVTVTGGDAPTDGGGVLSTDGPVRIVGSTIAGNQAAGYGGGIFHDSDTTLTIEGSAVRDNAAFDFGGGVGVYGGLVMTGTIVQSNSIAADDAYGGGIFVHPGDAGDAAVARISTSTIATNHADGANGLGGGIYVDADSLVLDTSTVSENTAGGDGGGIYAYYDTSIVRSTISGNRSGGSGGGVFSSATGLDVDTSTVVANTAAVAGGGIGAEGFDLDLTYATLQGNTAPAGAHVDLGGGTLTVFGTVFAEPVGGPGCSALTTSSQGYSFEAATDSCGLRAATDVVAGPSAELGGLADNGGPTPTELPAATSPLVAAIPADDPACTGSDQRGVSRPQLGGCDIGAVELAAADLPATEDTTAGARGSATAAVAVSARPSFTG